MTIEAWPTVEIVLERAPEDLRVIAARLNDAAGALREIGHPIGADFLRRAADLAASAADVAQRAEVSERFRK
jgi:hypothetical protein